MRQDRKNTNPSGASITTHLSGRHEDRLAELGQVHAPMQSQRAAGNGGGERQIARDRVGEDDVGDETGEGHAGGHVVVDAQHVGAQTLVHCDIGTRADAACIPVVDLSHVVHPFDFSSSRAARSTELGDAPPRWQGGHAAISVRERWGVPGRTRAKAQSCPGLTLLLRPQIGHRPGPEHAPGAESAEQGHQHRSRPASLPLLPSWKRQNRRPSPG